MPGLILQSAAPSRGVRNAGLLGGVTTFAGDEPSAIENSELSQLLSHRWTAARNSDERLELLIRQNSFEPAQSAGLANQKGQIAVGYDADLVIWNPEYSVAGTEPLLYGLVRQVIVAGQTRVSEGVLV